MSEEPEEERNQISNDSVSDTDLHNIKEKRDFYANQYVDRVTDFIKYTTPLSLAAILWIGGSYNQFSGLSKIFVIISLILLFISIYLAITIFFAGIRFSSMNLGSYQVINDIYHDSWEAINVKSGYNVKKFVEGKLGSSSLSKNLQRNRQFFLEIKEGVDQLNQKHVLTEARVWDTFVRIHIFSIFIGFVLYILAVVTNQKII